METRIPEHPDQSLFIQYWYSFYLGFNLADGTPLVMGEAWRDVDPGNLPRTITEMEESRHRSVFEQQIEQLMSTERIVLINEAATHQNIEDAMDQLLLEVENEEVGQSLDAEPTTVEPATVVIEVEQEVEEEFRHQEIPATQSPREELSSALLDYQALIREQLRQANQEGSAQVTVTPLSTEAQPPANARPLPEETPPRRNNTVSFGRAVRAHRRMAHHGASYSPRHMDRGSDLDTTTHPRFPFQQFQQGPIFLPRNFGEDDPLHIRRIGGVRNPIGLDVCERPKPLKEEEMTVRLECAICYHQKANIACLPCGHVVMCQW
jgi:hypothetical protein